MFAVTRIPPSLIEDRLDARYNAPLAVETRKKILTSGIKSNSVGGLYNLVCGPFGSTLTSDEHDASGEVLLIQPTNISGDAFSDASSWRITKKALIEKDLKTYPEGTLLFARVGIYPHVGIIPKEAGLCTISSSMIAGLPKSDIDTHFLVAFFKCIYGNILLNAAQKVTAQPTIGTTEIANTLVPIPKEIAQKYIGDKVRQAEQLRAWAKRLESSIEHLLTSNDEYLSVCNTAETRISRPELNDLSNRLDPKYYGNKAIAVHRFTRKTGRVLGSLIKSVANGFEERSFLENGLAYITVSEVSSGRLNAQAAPKISKSVDVPAKAIIHESCVLVVRTGSIGTAVKVHELDKGCAISSHLICLEFDDEETAAAVAVFLNSAAGKVLLHKISYGAVQPQIGQEELLALSIPEYVLNEKAKCLELLNNSELAIRASMNLTSAAKTLVEALIEGQLTEQQLIQAQQALEDGDNSLDQAILSKLSNEGYAIEGATPLFSDIDELYRLLESAAQTEAEE